MSIKETIKEVKQELNSDEQMLASAFKIEKLYKKHKLKIFTVVGIAVILFGGTAVKNYMQEQKLIAANVAFLTLQENPKDEKALLVLESKNPALFELFTYKNALKNSNKEAFKTLSNSKNEIIADLSKYNLNLLEGKPVESKLYEDVSYINNASLLIKAGKITAAKEELELVPQDSPAYNISKMIKHYTIKGQ